MAKLTDLTPDNKNFNKGSEFGNSLIEKSFRKFGAGRSILIDKNNRIIAGNKSVENAMAIGMEDVQIVESDGTKIIAVKRTDIDLDSIEGREMALADNASAKANIVFDAELVEAELGEAVCEEWGIDVATKLEAEEDDFDVAVEGIETDIVLGDLFEIGEHRLLCGDSTDSDAVARLMDNKKADMVFTDPPYKIQTEGGCNGTIGQGLKKQGKDIEFISNFEPTEFLQVLPLIFDKNKLNAYIFCNKELLPDYLVWARDSGYSFNVLIWKKPNAIPIGDSHRPDIEYLLLFRKSAIWNNGLKDVNYSRCLEFGRESGLHPTMKPIELIANEMKISSNQNSLIFDFFLGSGSTMVASHQLKRKCYGMELDPKYCQVIVDRMIKLDSTLVIKKNGQPYDVQSK
jgi:DNA modification methylase